MRRIQNKRALHLKAWFAVCGQASKLDIIFFFAIDDILLAF